MTLPEGTLTFLRSDIEGSMELVRTLGIGYDELNAEHAAIVRAAVAEHGGRIVRTEGDAFFVVFTAAEAAARAAIDIQLGMTAHAWPSGHEPRLRIGLHTGSATRAGDDYGGFEVNRAARIAATGWGGQIVLSDPTRALLMDGLPEGWSIRDLGDVRLKGVLEPERIHQLEVPDLRRRFPPLRESAAAGDRLPRRSTSFIGREDDLDRLDGLLAETRLLTLTGPGGTGKSSLATELARRHADRHADGAWFVDLQAIRVVGEVRPAIAHGLGLFDGPAGSAAERLHEFLAERALLVILDNFEQVIDAADEVTGILDASPASRVIVTSRIPLRISAEQEYPVRPLGSAPLDGSEIGEAERLFIDRARRIRPHLPLDREVETIREICQLVDGLPLAIELCAARVGVLPVAAIRERLARRLPLPGTGPRDLPERQRTIEDAVAWSHDLLEPPLQVLLARLAVFEESFDLEQAEIVCGPSSELGIDVLEGLASLVERSLLLRVDGEPGVRFRALDTIHAFAQQRLAARGEEGDMRRRHSGALAALAAREGAHLLDSGRPEAIARLEADDANLRTAMAFAVQTGDVPTALPLAADVWRYWVATGRLQLGMELTSAAMQLPAAAGATHSRLAGLEALGGLRYWGGDMPGASACYEEQLEIARALEDERAQADAWFNLAFTRQELGHEWAALAIHEAERRYRELGDEAAESRVSWAKAVSTMRTGGSEHSAAELAAVVARLEQAGDPWSASTAHSLRAMLALASGAIVDAARSMLAALRIGLVLRDHADVVVALMPTSVIVLSSGDAEGGAVLFGAGRAAAERFGIIPPAFEFVTGVADPDAAFVEALGREAYEAALDTGGRLSLDEALDVLEQVIDRLPAGTPGA